ncbi:glycoside hydrolase family 71 protein, partial [Aspergillus glaucus CBS 516.65]
FPNTVQYDTFDWEDDMRLAKDAHIDAFALNLIHGDRVDKLSTAFEIAEKTNFKLFLSFDYANDPKDYGSWPMEDVLHLIRQYSGHKAYYRHDGRPFVTTFEGADRIQDWKAIKEATGCYFIPNWGSLGAKQAAQVGNGVVDGLTSWTAWSWGAEDMNTYNDAAYIEALSSDGNSNATGIPYMMPVSPWFYTNLDAYKKNWLWRGDDLWYHRWQQVFLIRPEFLMIISWNGYGESHYLGPLRENAFVEFEQASVNYARDIPHDGWRLILPYLIDTYKTGIATVQRESLIAWHRLQPAQVCSDGNTTGNTAGYFQYEFAPLSIVQDRIFFSAVLTAWANVSVQIGNAVLTPEWKYVPEGEVGLYHGSVSFSGHTGTTIVNIWRSGKIIAAAYGNTITNDCSKTGNRTNWNAWVGLGQTPWNVSATQKLSIQDQACINGTGWDELKTICEWTCSYGYCPLNTCYCTTMGTPQKPLDGVGMIGYPVPGKDDRYIPLCAWSCANGYCPQALCGTQQVTPVPRNDTWCLHDTCTSGTGEGKLEALCQFSCAYGYCPMHSCQCKETGPLVGAPSGKPVLVTVKPWLDPFLYEGLCNFACSHGYCPSAICDGPTMIGGLGDVVYLDPGVWSDPAPTVTCSPPCTFVPAPLTLGTPTVIEFELWSTVIPYLLPEGMKTTFGGGQTTHYTVYSTIDVTTALQIEPGECCVSVE